jgi:hypothetical protein
MTMTKVRTVVAHPDGSGVIRVEWGRGTVWEFSVDRRGERTDLLALHIPMQHPIVVHGQVLTHLTNRANLRFVDFRDKQVKVSLLPYPHPEGGTPAIIRRDPAATRLLTQPR